MGAPGFKDLVAADISAVFLNDQEFAGTHTIDGKPMQNNLPLLDIFVFEAGTVLQTPDPPKDDKAENLPIWRTP